MVLYSICLTLSLFLIQNSLGGVIAAGKFLVPATLVMILKCETKIQKRELFCSLWKYAISCKPASLWSGKIPKPWTCFCLLICSYIDLWFTGWFWTAFWSLYVQQLSCILSDLIIGKETSLVIYPPWLMLEQTKFNYEQHQDILSGWQHPLYFHYFSMLWVWIYVLLLSFMRCPVWQTPSSSRPLHQPTAGRAASVDTLIFPLDNRYR